MDKFIIKKQPYADLRSFKVAVPGAEYAKLENLKKETGLNYGQLVALMINYCTDPDRLEIR